MQRRFKSTNYESVPCSGGCGTVLLRKTGVVHPTCIDCKQKRAREHWSKRDKTYAHSKTKSTR